MVSTPPTRTDQLFAELNSTMATPSAGGPPPTSNAQPVRKYLLRNRPIWDVDREFDLEELEEENPEAFKAFEKKYAQDYDKYNEKLASDFPDWPWAVSELGNWYEDKYYLEAQMRDQDKWGLHIYNDYSGYGMQEVIENLVGRLCPSLQTV